MNKLRVGIDLREFPINSHQMHLIQPLFELSHQGGHHHIPETYNIVEGPKCQNVF